MSIIKTNARSASALDATILTGNLPAISGASLTGVSAGKVLQVVSGSYSGSTTTTSTSYVDTTAGTFSITPSATSSKILVDFGASPHVNTFANSNQNIRLYLTIYRDINGGGYSNIGSANGISTERVGDSITSNTQDGTHRVVVMDSPNTTSQCNYKLYFKTGGGEIYWNLATQQHTVTLMEISA
tara:strand:+ start:194 stop:748 length:555 start_codon:yes stop_codon:yes gene_type:complete